MIGEGRGTIGFCQAAVRPYLLVTSPHHLVTNQLFIAEFFFGGKPILFR
jgi:hypothetical protein